jgi:solute:Na+ symporter, SSS family
MFGLSVLDLAVIVLYFVIVIAIGIWSMRRISNQEDYFLAGRRFGKFIQTFAAFGQGTSVDTCVGVTMATYSNGAGGIWASLLYLFVTPLYWMVIPWMRRLRLLTLGDFFEERYGSKKMAAVYAVIGSIGMMAIISVGFSAMTKTVLALAPKQVCQLSEQESAEYQMALELETLREKDYNSLTAEQQERLAELIKQNPSKFFSHIDSNVLIWIVSIIVMVYAILGGLEAAFLTDTIQGIFIIVLSLVLIPFGWSKINTIYGGATPLDAVQTVHRQLPESFFQIFGSPAAMDFTWYYIIALSIMATINVVTQPNILVANGSAKGEYECRFGFVAGGFMKRFVTIFWGFFALMAVVLYHDKVHDPDIVWGYATLDLLGPLNMGLVGLMIACLMAALMSTADCLMITCASLLTHNLYKPLFPNKSENHYISAGRIMGGLVIIGAALIAIQFDTILQILKFIWELNVMVAASFWLGMKWRTANKIGAWSSIVTTTILFFVLPLLVPQLWPALRTNQYLLKLTHSQPITQEYTVHQMDIDQRNQEILSWQKLSIEQKSITPEPVPLQSGQKFLKTYIMPAKSIFWTQEIKVEKNGRSSGSGMLNLELVVYDKLGFDLANNSYALNETIRILIRTFIPFIILIVVSLLTRPDDKKMLDRFFVKMKTPVDTDHAEDARQLAQSYAKPQRFENQKLFPHSNWEFDKWNKTDTTGFLVSIFGVAVVVGMMYFLVSVGG